MFQKATLGAKIKVQHLLDALSLVTGAPFFYSQQSQKKSLVVVGLVCLLLFVCCFLYSSSAVNSLNTESENELCE